jgi:hypothetical protein
MFLYHFRMVFQRIKDNGRGHFEIFYFFYQDVILDDYKTELP